MTTSTKPMALHLGELEPRARTVFAEMNAATFGDALPEPAIELRDLSESGWSASFRSRPWSWVTPLLIELDPEHVHDTAELRERMAHEVAHMAEFVTFGTTDHGPRWQRLYDLTMDGRRWHPDDPATQRATSARSASPSCSASKPRTAARSVQAGHAGTGPQVVAKTTGTVNDYSRPRGDQTLRFTKGQKIAADHWAVREWPDSFTAAS